MTATMTRERLYSASDVVGALGITYRRIDYWARIGLVEPTRPAAGPGSVRGYSVEDAVRLAVIDRLMAAGHELSSAAAAGEAYRVARADLSHDRLFLVADEGDWVAVPDTEFDVIYMSIVTVVAVDPIRREIETALDETADLKATA